LSSTGLRELKKAQTRQAIVDAAERLFAERGFEATTIEDVAAVAQVTKKTVFNHFSTKEDLALDRAGGYRRALLSAIHDRPAAATVLDAFRSLSHRQVRQLGVLRQHLRASGDVFSLIDSSPALQQRMATYQQELVSAVASQLHESLGADPGDPWPAVVACALVGTQAILFGRLRELAASTTRQGRAQRLYTSDVDRVYDRLANGVNIPIRGTTAASASALPINRHAEHASETTEL
jgi:AcrR family transcriptional regulator